MRNGSSSVCCGHAHSRNACRLHYSAPRPAWNGNLNTRLCALACFHAAVLLAHAAPSVCCSLLLALSRVLVTASLHPHSVDSFTPLDDLKIDAFGMTTGMNAIGCERWQVASKPGKRERGFDGNIGGEDRQLSSACEAGNMQYSGSVRGKPAQRCGETASTGRLCGGATDSMKRCQSE